MGGEPLPTVLRDLLAHVAPPEGVPDAVLLQRFAAHGDEAAFEALVRRHGPLVLNVCLGVLHNSHDADDVFQATFLVLARKADSIRKQDALGSFLYGVAQRIARTVRARAVRRRERERQAAKMPSPEPNDDLDRRELRALLCAELEQVAEEYRSALRLFYLEGKSYAETARLLRCPIGTVRSRLARGREALRQRLVGRDPSRATAGVCVPAGLLAATIEAAVRGGASPPVQALAEEALRGLALSKVKTVLAVLLAVGVLAVTTGLLASQRTRPRPPGDEALTVQHPTFTEVPNRPGPPRLDVTGRALDDRGGPVVGATVYLREWTPWRGPSPDDVLAVTHTDHRGAFAFRGVMGRAATSAWEAEQHPWQVVVVAPGRAVVWQHLTPEVRRRGLELRLESGSRLTGRLMGPTGRPVRGAVVRVIELAPLDRRATSRGPSSWGVPSWRKDALVLQVSGVPLTARSDAQGRFVLDTLPAGMLVRLAVSSRDHLWQALSAATTATPQPNLIHEHFSSGKKWLFVEPVRTGDWTIRLQPAGRLTGRVLEAGSDRPVSGARVTVFSAAATADAHGHLIFDEVIQGFRVAANVTATADARGLFCLAPLPPVSTWVVVRGPDGTDYLGVSQALPWPQRGQPEGTFHLKRGVALTGRVVDPDSGRGIAGVAMTYQSEGDPGPAAGCSASGPVRTDAQGRFRIVVPAGQGKLTADGATADYHDRQSHPVDAAANGPPRPLTISLRRGLAIRGRVLGPDGRGIRGAEVKLEGEAEPGYPLRACVSGEGGTFHLDGLPPGSAYEWVVIHPTLRLGAHLPQALDPGGKEPLRVDVRLAPLASLTGRALGPDRSPLAGAAVRIIAVVNPPGRHRREVEVAALGSDGGGRFCCDRLLPRPHHRFRVEVTAPGHVGLRGAAFEVRPGVVRALPDLVLPAVGPEVSGTVVSAAGRPLADVRLRALLPDPGSGRSLMAPRPVVTGRDGRFRLGGLPCGALELVAEQCVPGAHAPGGPAGPTMKVKVGADRKALVLRLRAGG